MISTAQHSPKCRCPGCKEGKTRQEDQPSALQTGVPFSEPLNDRRLSSKDYPEYDEY